ncbi:MULTISPECIES: hypothetical protein [Aerococcus]|uniref:CopG family transcriptional regulator n=2 Tax=Aerococcus TaxID=1375 RepID=A0A1E9PGR5_9LACT|nr:MULTISPECIES: hypothetical protein [Aerococcus]MBU5611286.1 hypothetical protein [Aerococcus urinae]MCY3034025.1 hypothetical protein [Aerococcus mictus]MCY3065793.1 hypothetical protein [Aerococcus mictus]MCY3066451.1 hypothetical protein [Aerococcus mictus]MCY3071376.1 hypothetical protein [Aerococcus mictus]
MTKKKYIRKNIRMSEDEVETLNELIKKLPVENFTEFIRYSLNYFSKTKYENEYNKKILQDISRDTQLTYLVMNEYMKILSEARKNDFDIIKKEVENKFDEDMKAKLVKKNYRTY